jgi:glycosyltransferase involved in cell wall biosynthesis
VRDSLVSFVVIAYNEERQISACLASIVSQQGLGAYEVIVVNDGSTDRTAACVAEFARDHESVQLVTQQNAGRGAARARGVESARGDLVAMVDGDIVLPSDWLERCSRELAEHSYDAVGGVAVPDGDATFVCDFFRLVPRVRSPTTTVTGNNGLYARALLDRVKFDRNFRLGEDVAFNHALEAAGFTSQCLSGVVVMHREDKGYIGSLRWLFQSGVSASDHLRRFRKLRTPDVTFVGALVVPIVSIPLFGTRIGGALTGAYLLAVGGAHLAGKAEIKREPAYFARYGVASLTNATLTTSYLLGRVVGLVVRGPRDERDKPVPASGARRR